MSDGPKLLSGGNPQIPKGYGDGPVQAYIAAMPGWKRPLGEHLDALVVATVPEVSKAVKWNQPLYGAGDPEHWFLSFRCFTRYVKLTFYNCSLLEPNPPESSTQGQHRHLNIHEDDEPDTGLLESWIRQAAALPGEKL
jgi:hypothetical protein